MPTFLFVRIGRRHFRPAHVIGNFRRDIPARRNPDKALVLAAYGAAAISAGCCAWATWIL